MVNATNLIPKEKPRRILTEQEFVAIMVASGLLSLIGLVLLIVCLLRRRSNPESSYMQIQGDE